MTQYGLNSSGFTKPRQADIISALQVAFQSRFGNTVNVSSSTVFGQLIAIFSEREALLWEAIEDDVLSQSVAGASGVYVDNLLALVGLTRLPAQATVTDPTAVTQPDGKIVSGFELFGDPGTVVSAGAIFQTTTTPAISFTLDSEATIQAAANDVQDLYLSGTPTSGSYTLTLEAPSGASLTTPAIAWNALATQAMLTYPTAPTSGTYTLHVGTLTTANLAFNASASDIQAALRLLTGLDQVTVAGNQQNGMAITFASPQVPSLTVGNSTNGTITAVNSVATAIQGLTDASASQQPFTDVQVSKPSGIQVRLAFGALKAADGQPSSTGTAQGNVTLASNSLYAGSTAINVSVTHTIAGAPARAVATATCTETGAIAVSANTLTVVGSSQAGLTGCNNPLDCLTGRSVETDAEAIARRTALVGSTGAGPLQATLGALQQVQGVSAAIAFQNTSSQALQLLTFLGTPSSGAYILSMEGGTTGSLRYDAPAYVVQDAIAQIAGFASVKVTGNPASGFSLDFSACFGGQALPLIEVVSDSTSAQLTATWGRPSHAVEYVVEGGTDRAVAAAILANAPGGIGLFGAPVLITTGNGTYGQTSISLQSVDNLAVGMSLIGQGLAAGSVVTAINGQTVSLNAPLLANMSNVAVTASRTVTLPDAAGNPIQISFTRPTQLPVYVTVALVSDRYNTPGDANSGINAESQFDPASATVVAQRIIDTINAVKIGGTLTRLGSLGVESSFRDVAGILDVSLAFDLSPNPVNTQPIKLLPEQAPIASLTTVQVAIS